VIEEAASLTVQIEILWFHPRNRKITQSPDHIILSLVMRRHQWRNNHRHDTTSVKSEDQKRCVIVELDAEVLGGLHHAVVEGFNKPVLLVGDQNSG
jgi:hypothetical protein